MSDWLGLQGARVLVAGAGTLGAALVQGFAEVGAEVAVIDVSAERLHETGAAAGIRAERLIAADLSAADAARAAMAETQAALGGLDVFVHGVGINDRRPIEA